MPTEWIADEKDSAADFWYRVICYRLRIRRPR